MNYPENYKKNNPNILKKIETNLDNSFHYLFMGPVGCGKTHLAKIIANSIDDINTKEVSAIDVYSEYLFLLDSNYTDKNEQLKKLKHSLRGKFVIFDDLGAESPKSKSSRNFIASVLQDGYSYFKKMRENDNIYRSIITTNLDGKQIKNLYGDRVIDRLQELYTIMKFKPTSFRKQKKETIKY